MSRRLWRIWIEAPLRRRISRYLYAITGFARSIIPPLFANKPRGSRMPLHRSLAWRNEPQEPAFAQLPRPRNLAARFLNEIQHDHAVSTCCVTGPKNVPAGSKLASLQNWMRFDQPMI